MAAQSEQRFEPDGLQSPWPALAWIVLAVIIAVTALMLAPVPN
jgi:hypothetical protein